MRGAVRRRACAPYTLYGDLLSEASPVVVMGDLFSPEEAFIFFIAPLIICIVAWFALSAAAVVLGLIVKRQSEGSGPEPG